MIPVRDSADGHALVEQYEALRQDVVGKDGCRSVVRGLALIMRKGMAAWMRGIGEEPAPVTAPVASTAQSPDGFERDLIDIVAAMALATAATATAGGMT